MSGASSCSVAIRGGLTDAPIQRDVAGPCRSWSNFVCKAVSISDGGEIDICKSRVMRNGARCMEACGRRLRSFQWY